MISLLRNIDLKLAPKKPNQNLSKNSILIKKKGKWYVQIVESHVYNNNAIPL